jgi:hypothetical protein
MVPSSSAHISLLFTVDIGLLCGPVSDSSESLRSHWPDQVSDSSESLTWSDPILHVVTTKISVIWLLIYLVKISAVHSDFWLIQSRSPAVHLLQNIIKLPDAYCTGSHCGHTTHKFLIVLVRIFFVVRVWTFITSARLLAALRGDEVWVTTRKACSLSCSSRFCIQQNPPHPRPPPLPLPPAHSANHLKAKFLSCGLAGSSLSFLTRAPNDGDSEDVIQLLQICQCGSWWGSSTGFFVDLRLRSGLCCSCCSLATRAWYSGPWPVWTLEATEVIPTRGIKEVKMS